MCQVAIVACVHHCSVESSDVIFVSISCIACLSGYHLVCMDMKESSNLVQSVVQIELQAADICAEVGLDGMGTSQTCLSLDPTTWRTSFLLSSVYSW